MFTRVLRRSATSSVLAGFLTLSMAAPSQACFFNMFGGWGAPTRTYYAPFAPTYGPAYAAPGCNTCGYAPMVYSGSPCATGNCGTANCSTGNCATGNCSTESTTYQSPDSEQLNKEPTSVDEKDLEPIRSRRDNPNPRRRNRRDEGESTYTPRPETSREDENWNKTEPGGARDFGAPNPNRFDSTPEPNNGLNSTPEPNNGFNSNIEPNLEEPMGFGDEEGEFKSPMNTTPDQPAEPAADPVDFGDDPFGDAGKTKKSEQEHKTAKVAKPEEQKADAEKTVTAAKKEASKSASEAPVSSPEEIDEKAAAKEKVKTDSKSKDPQSFNTLNLDTRLSRHVPTRTRTRTTTTSGFQAPKLARTKASKSRQTKPAANGTKLVSR